MLLRRIPATRFAEFFTSLIFACCSAAGFVYTPAKNSCACPLLAMFAEHRCACEPVVRSGLRSAKSSVLKNYKIAVSEQLTYREANKNFSKFFLSVMIYQLLHPLLFSAVAATAFVQLVAHFLFFNVEIVLVVFVRLHDDGHAVGDGDAITGEADAFCGVIGNQADAGESEVCQNLCTHAVITKVGSKAKANVRINGIKTLVLQCIGSDFISQTNTTALLTHINDSAAAFLFNHLQCGCQLIATVAAQAAEGITCQALAVYAHEHILFTGNITLDNSNMAKVVQIIFICNDAEIAVFSRQRSLSGTMHHFFVCHAISNKLGNGDENELMLFGELD